MIRTLFLLFVRPLLITIAVIIIMLLVGHFRLGERSPGVLQLAKSGLTYWIPLLVLLFFVAPSFYGVWVLLKIRTQAKSAGVTISQYLEQVKKQRSGNQGD